MEFAVGPSPARQLCAERSFVVSAAPADGGTRRGFIFILFSFGLFRPPSPQLCSEHSPHTPSLWLVLSEPLRCTLEGWWVRSRWQGLAVTALSPGGQGRARLSMLVTCGGCGAAAGGFAVGVCLCLVSLQGQEPKDTDCVCVSLPLSPDH